MQKRKIVHLNIRSLRSTSHLIELRDWAAANKTDVITVSETWLNTTVTNSEVSIGGYKPYRQDRLRKRGGGVCAYIRKDITVTVLKDISHLSDNYFHQFWLKLQYRKLRSVVICISYRPPRLQNSPYFCVFKHARAVKQKVWNEAENRERD